MRQITLAAGTFEGHRKPTRREAFLSDMEKVVPWQGGTLGVDPIRSAPRFQRPHGGVNSGFGISDDR